MRFVATVCRGVLRGMASGDCKPGAGAGALPNVVFVLGGPGAGKGTQCDRIVKEFGYAHLSAGDLLRAERANPESAVGELIENCIRESLIVPVHITCSLLEKAMWSRADCSTFLIDGFPRNRDNLDGWERQMAGKARVKFVILFDCDKQTCTERCLTRGAAGSGRSDDNLECLIKRFDTYMTSTVPIIEHYSSLGLVRRVDGTRTPDQVFADVRKLFAPTTTTTPQAQGGDSV